MVLTHGIPPNFHGGVSIYLLFKLPYAIRSVPSLSANALGTDGVHCQESAGTGPVVLKVVRVTTIGGVGDVAKLAPFWEGTARK